MADAAIELTDKHLDKIGSYVRSHFHRWLLEDRDLNGDVVSNQLNRLENSLEAAIVLSRERFELIRERFEQVDNKFDQVDKRFEQVNKRIEQVDKRFEQVDRRFDEQINLIRTEFANRTELEHERFGFLDKRMNRQFAVSVTLASTMLAAVLGVLIQGFFF